MRRRSSATSLPAATAPARAPAVATVAAARRVLRRPVPSVATGSASAGGFGRRAMVVAEPFSRIVRQPGIGDGGSTGVADAVAACVEPGQRALDVGQFLLDPLE